MIKRSKNGERFEVYGRRNGKKVYVGTYDSRREAEAVERRYLVTQEQIAAGELPPEIDLKRTLNEATDEWLASLKASKSRSHGAYGEFLKYQVLPRLGDAAIAKVTKARIMGWRDEVATSYAPTTVNSALICLSSAFSYFVDRGWLATNPCYGVSQLEVHEHSYNWIKTRGELRKAARRVQRRPARHDRVRRRNRRPHRRAAPLAVGRHRSRAPAHHRAAW